MEEMGCAPSKTTTIASAGTELPLVKLVSLDVDKANVHDLLRKHQSSGTLNQFFENIGSLENEISSYPAPKFIHKTHVTMAYAGADSAKSEELISRFRHLQGKEVAIAITGFLWSATNGALAIEISPSTLEGDSLSVPFCENEFQHITVWCSDPWRKKSWSNRLPGQLEREEASRVDFPHCDELIGKLTFWNQKNNPISVE